MRDGQAQFTAIVERFGPAKVGKAIGVTEGSVRHAVAGRATPRPAVRERIRAAYGIPVEAWTSDVSAIESTKSQVGRQNPRKTPNLPPRAPVAKGEVLPRGDVPDADDPKANAVATLRILRRAVDHAKPDELPRIAAQITNASRLLARLTGQLDVTEAQILRSVAWMKLRRAVGIVLEGYPGAVEKLEAALAFEDG